MQESGGEAPLSLLYLRKDNTMKPLKENILQIMMPPLNEVMNK